MNKEAGRSPMAIDCKPRFATFVVLTLKKVAMDAKAKSKITAALNNIRCKEHGTKPEIRFSLDKVNVTNICCKNFETQVGNATTQAMGEYAKESIMDSFKKAGFKRK